MSLWSLGAASGFRQLDAARKGDFAFQAQADDVQPDDPKKENPDPKSVMAALAKYIPAETTSLFLAAVNLLQNMGEKPAGADERWVWAVYLACAFLTPAFVYLAARSTWRLGVAAQKPPFAAPRRLMGMSTMAFLAWGLAVPGVITDQEAAIWAVLAALFVSPVLVMIEQAFGLENGTGDTQ